MAPQEVNGEAEQKTDARMRHPRTSGAQTVAAAPAASRPASPNPRTYPRISPGKKSCTLKAGEEFVTMRKILLSRDAAMAAGGGQVIGEGGRRAAVCGVRAEWRPGERERRGHAGGAGAALPPLERRRARVRCDEPCTARAA